MNNLRPRLVVGERVWFIHRRRFFPTEKKTGVIVQTDGIFATVRIDSPQGLQEDVRLNVRSLFAEGDQRNE